MSLEKITHRATRHTYPPARNLDEEDVVALPFQTVVWETKEQPPRYEKPMSFGVMISGYLSAVVRRNGILYIIRVGLETVNLVGKFVAE